MGAHEVLADLLMRYTAELSSTSHSYAELAGRTATNISDVVRLWNAPTPQHCRGACIQRAHIQQQALSGH